MQHILIIAALLLFIISCTRAQSGSSKTLPEAQFSEQMKQPDAIILDVRTAGEFAGGHLPNALNIDVNQSDFTQKIANIDKSKMCLVYCQAGVRSNRAMKIMEGAGFTNVFELKGGYSGWTGEKVK